VSFALDVNILLYASDSDSPYHERAKAFLKFSFLDVHDSLL
jgi:predicted nucleic acid-binding protein